VINRAQVDWNSYDQERSSKNGSLCLPINIFSFLTSEMAQVVFFAFIFGMATINGLYPFGLAFMASRAFSRKNYLLPGIFSFLGILVVVRMPNSFRYLGAMMIFGLGFTFFGKQIQKSAFLTGALVFVSNAIAGTIFLTINGISPYDLLILTLESLLTGIMPFILIGGMPWLFKIPSQSAERNICIALLTGVMLSIAKSFTIFGINIRDICGVLGVIIMAFINGPGAGAATGIIIGVMGYASSLSPWLMGVLAFSGLVAGAFNKLGKLGVITGFSLGFLLYNLYVNSMGEIIISWQVLTISFVLLLLIPSSVTKGLSSYLCHCNDDGDESTKRIEDKLHELASLLEDLGSAFIRLPLTTSTQNGSGAYFDRVCKEAQALVCSNCGMRRVCWEKEIKRTVGSFYKFIQNYNGYSSKIDIPHMFITRCNKIEEITKIIQQQWEIYNLNQQIHSVVKSNQQLINNQFQKASEIIKTLASGTREDIEDTGMDERLLEKLKQVGLFPERVYTERDFSRYNVNIIMSSCMGKRYCESIVPKTVEEVLGRKASAEVIECPLKNGSAKCRLKVICEGVLGVSVGVAGVAKEGQNVSGDGFSFMELKDGKYLLALCDGMGVGKKASWHSEKTLALIERLLETGFDKETSLKIVNSAMMAFDGEEGFSTADLVIIDTHSGKTEFIKAGAPVGYVKRGSRVELIKGGSFPIGIMDVFSPKLVEKHLKPQDMVILATDGIIDALSEKENGENVLRRFLVNIKTSNPQEVADEILNMAKKKGKIKDDMTVLVASIWVKNPYSLCFFNDTA